MVGKVHVAPFSRKNRQVRKMFAKIGFPVLRLIRYRIGSLTLFGMKVGKVEVISII